MAFIIQLPFTGDINQLLAKGQEEAKNYNGKFSGDVKQGQFDFDALGGQFVGCYYIRNNIIEIQFTKKPFFIPIFVIENFLKTYIK
jgi:hypothetical protein